VKKILIVEDNSDNLDLLVQLLEDQYELVSAINGLQALDSVIKEHPDLILMDMAIPLIDGWEVTRRIKADPELHSIPIIGLSAHAMSSDVKRALYAGCEDYLTKPINFDLLFNALDRYLT
jgi:two-component system cell cycle response regulator DivK